MGPSEVRNFTVSLKSCSDEKYIQYYEYKNIVIICPYCILYVLPHEGGVQEAS